MIFFFFCCFSPPLISLIIIIIINGVAVSEGQRDALAHTVSVPLDNIKTHPGPGALLWGQKKKKKTSRLSPRGWGKVRMSIDMSRTSERKNAVTRFLFFFRIDDTDRNIASIESLIFL